MDGVSQALSLIEMVPLEMQSDLVPDVTVLQVAAILNFDGLEQIPAAEMKLFSEVDSAHCLCATHSAQQQ